MERWCEMYFLPQPPHLIPYFNNQPMYFEPGPPAPPAPPQQTACAKNVVYNGPGPEVQFLNVNILPGHRMVCSKGDYTPFYDTQQINGQLVSTLRGVHYPKRGTEIFVKNVPRDALLQDVLEFSIHCGDVHQIRLLMDFSGYNRGYCFITYLSKNAARKAAVTLNGNYLKGCPVVVKLSFDNNKLEMRGIPAGVSRDEIFGAMSEIGHGLQQIITFRNNPNGRNVCVLKYDTHRNALEARRKVWPKVVLWGRQIEVDWAVPHEVLHSKRLYFRKIPVGTTKTQLYDEVTNHIRPDSLLNMFVHNDLGYILFTSQPAALNALMKLREVPICGRYLEYSFSRFVPRYRNVP